MSPTRLFVSLFASLLVFPSFASAVGPPCGKSCLLSEKEKAIERQLMTPIGVSFDDVPLSRVIEEIRSIKDIPIDIDTLVLQEAGISIESKISIKLEHISLKSALNLILHQVRLAYVIKDEVIFITTEENARYKLRTVTYGIGDLVEAKLPFFQGPGKKSPQSETKGFMPVCGSFRCEPPSLPSLAELIEMTNRDTQQTNTQPTLPWEEELIRFITCAILPKSWSDLGGPCTIEYVPQTMSLVINQAGDVHEEIQDLLALLRKAQEAYQVKTGAAFRR